MSRKIMVAGNWKLNNSVSESIDLVTAIAEGVADRSPVEVVVAPPFTAIFPVAESLEKSTVAVAAQNLFWETSGAFTGEVSPKMVKEAGAKWVILGHSERRQLFGETDVTVARRVSAALHVGLKPIFCVGETLDERQAGKTFDVIDGQIEGGIGHLSADEMKSVVIAYEPVWAIGTGVTASPEQAEEVHAHIRRLMVRLWGESISAATRILYGGSVKPDNAAELFGQENIDGGLIGGASLKASDFLAIIKAGNLSE